MATTLRFVLLGDDRASTAFQRFARQVDGANGAIDRNNTALKRQSAQQDKTAGGLFRLTGTVTGFSHAAVAGSGRAGMFARGLAAVNIATSFGQPLMAGLVVTAGALVSALTIGAAAAAAYGAAVIPAFKQASALAKGQAGLQAITTKAQATYSAALKSGVSQQAAAAARTRTLTAAQQQYQTTLSKAPAPIRQLAAGMTAAQKAYKDWGASLARPVLRPITDALHIVHPLLRAAAPLARTFGNALDVLVKSAEQPIADGGLLRWVRSVQPFVAPLVIHLGSAIGHIVVGIGAVARDFAPFAVGLVKGLDTITGKFQTWAQTLTGHSGFRSLIATFHQETPLAIQVLKNLGIVLANVARATTGLASPGNSRALLQILIPLTQVMAQLSRNQALVRAIFYFLLLRASLKQVSGAVSSVRSGWEGVNKVFAASQSAYGVVGRFVGGFRNANVASSAFSGTAGTLGGKLKIVTVAIGQATVAAYASTVAWVKTAAAWVAAKVASIAAAVASRTLTAAQWLLNVALSANPIGIVVLAIGALVAAFVIAWTHSATFRKILIATWNAIKAAAVAVFNWFAGPFVNFFAKTIPRTFNTVLTWVRRNWPWLLGALTGPIGLAVVWIIKHWATLINGIHDTWNKVTAFLGSIPGRIQGYFKGALGWLVTAGRNVIQGLWNGLLAIWHKVTSFISGIAKWIQQHKGPVSLDAHLLEPAGRALMNGLLGGLTAGFGPVGGFISGLTGKIASLFGGGSGGSGNRALAMKLFPWPMSMFAAFDYVEMREAGYSMTARNPSSGAYGMAQFINGPGEYAQWGGNAITAAGQLIAMFNYIHSRYGNPVVAAAHEAALNWYKLGAYRVPRTGPAVVHQGEMILPQPLAEAIRRGFGGGRGGGQPVLNVEHMHISQPADALLFAKTVSFEWRHGGGLG